MVSSTEWRPSEHLSAVPLDMARCREFRTWTRLEREAVQFVDRAPWANRAKRARDLHLMLGREAESAPVEELVVQRAEGKTVVEVVGALEVEPAYVSCLDAH